MIFFIGMELAIKHLLKVKFSLVEMRLLFATFWIIIYKKIKLCLRMVLALEVSLKKKFSVCFTKPKNNFFFLRNLFFSQLYKKLLNNNNNLLNLFTFYQHQN